jgi:hypothetical protein
MVGPAAVLVVIAAIYYYMSAAVGDNEHPSVPDRKTGEVVPLPLTLGADAASGELGPRSDFHVADSPESQGGEDASKTQAKRKYWQHGDDLALVISGLQLPREALLDYLDIPRNSRVWTCETDAIERLRHSIIAEYEHLHDRYSSALMQRAFEIEKENFGKSAPQLGSKREGQSDQVCGIVYVGSNAPIHVYRDENPNVFEAHTKILELPRELRYLLLSRLSGVR